MIQFQCDYTEGAHENIIKKLVETNMDQTVGYGMDGYCESARARIREKLGNPDADVHFTVGGTQTNLIVISSILKPYQGVLSADAGHIAVHETGAIEATGHKVLTLPSNDGLISAKQVEDALASHFASSTAEHEVQPGMVYISFPTESGTIYSKKQLGDIYGVCRKYGVPLFVDGARLGYGLESPSCDMTIAEFASLCDVFYIGGTKCGALFGEAVVITNDALKKDFRYMLKQRGAMLAKGRLLGIQFDELMRDDLYFKICRAAVDKAMKIRNAFVSKGVAMFGSSMTNQQFPILTKAQLEYFGKKYSFEIWGPYDNDRTVARFCTSWATSDENLNSLLGDIENMPM